MSTPSGPFLLAQSGPNNPPGTSLIPLSVATAGRVGVQAAALLTGNNNNFALADDTLILLVTASGGGDVLTGLAGGVPGRVLYLQVLTAATFSITSEDANSIAANRILAPVNGNAEFLTVQFQGAVLVYDGTNSRWRLIGKPDAA